MFQKKHLGKFVIGELYCSWEAEMQGRDPQSGSDDFRGTFSGRRALEPLPRGSSQGHPALDTVGTLRAEVATPGGEMPRRNNEPGMREQQAETWTTEELKSRVREGPVDQQVVLELVRRLEEVELRTKSSSSLHSALEHVHSEARPHQLLPYGRETGRVEVQGCQASGSPGIVTSPGAFPYQPHMPPAGFGISRLFQAPSPSLHGLPTYQPPASNHGLPTYQSSASNPGFPTHQPSASNPGFPTYQSSVSNPRFPTHQPSASNPGFPTHQPSASNPGFPTYQSSVSNPGFPTYQSLASNPGFPTHQPSAWVKHQKMK